MLSLYLRTKYILYDRKEDIHYFAIIRIFMFSLVYLHHFSCTCLLTTHSTFKQNLSFEYFHLLDKTNYEIKNHECSCKLSTLFTFHFLLSLRVIIKSYILTVLMFTTSLHYKMKVKVI